MQNQEPNYLVVGVHKNNVSINFSKIMSTECINHGIQGIHKRGCSRGNWKSDEQNFEYYQNYYA
ncbi:hypothetical protein SPTER_04580 [Sporomusa termitida]|uniref:Uncharacterized protein n=1 Tax=Sporomusa termitida TaxID=2377 RepID=A0A517DPA2_9FIRM|nr:hypothetical protein SPTER_04580 [Sporomusa termitida]